MNKTTRQLATIRHKCGDYTQVIERYAVIQNGQRVGTVHKYLGHSGPTFYDPLRGTAGPRSDGKNITAGGHIKRFYSIDEAVAAI